MSDAISVGDGGIGLGGAFDLLTQVGGVRFMNYFPKAVVMPAPVGGSQAGQILDVRAGKLQAEIRALAENDAGPIQSSHATVHPASRHEGFRWGRGFGAILDAP